MYSYFDKLLSAVEISIKDEKIRDFTLQVVYLVDSRNWEKAASRNHHPPDERGEFGNTIHTLRVLRVTEDILSCTDKTEYDKDISKCVAILHDSCRYASDGGMSYTDPHHAKLVLQFIKDCEIEVPDQRILEGIANHMGPFVPKSELKYYPQLTVSDIAHLADLIASKETNIIQI
jgi:hypothetical protein